MAGNSSRIPPFTQAPVPPAPAEKRKDPTAVHPVTLTATEAIRPKGSTNATQTARKPSISARPPSSLDSRVTSGVGEVLSPKTEPSPLPSPAPQPPPEATQRNAPRIPAESPTKDRPTEEDTAPLPVLPPKPSPPPREDEQTSIPSLSDSSLFSGSTDRLSPEEEPSVSDYDADDESEEDPPNSDLETRPPPNCALSAPCSTASILALTASDIPKIRETYITWGGFKYKVWQEVSPNMSDDAWDLKVAACMRALEKIPPNDPNFRPGIEALDISVHSSRDLIQASIPSDSHQFDEVNSSVRSGRTLVIQDTKKSAETIRACDTRPYESVTFARYRTIFKKPQEVTKHRAAILSESHESKRAERSSRPTGIKSYDPVRLENEGNQCATTSVCQILANAPRTGRMIRDSKHTGTDSAITGFFEQYHVLQQSAQPKSSMPAGWFDTIYSQYDSSMRPGMQHDVAEVAETLFGGLPDLWVKQIECGTGPNGTNQECRKAPLIQLAVAEGGEPISVDYLFQEQEFVPNQFAEGWPNTLMLNLNRTSRSSQKIHRKVNLNPILTLPARWVVNGEPSNEDKYELQGFVVHKGNNPREGGHYVAFVKIYDSSGTPRYWRCNGLDQLQLTAEQFLDFAHSREYGEVSFALYEKVLPKEGASASTPVIAPAFPNPVNPVSETKKPPAQTPAKTPAPLTSPVKPREITSESKQGAPSAKQATAPSQPQPQTPEHIKKALQTTRGGRRFLREHQRLGKKAQKPPTS